MIKLPAMPEGVSFAPAKSAGKKDTAEAVSEFAGLMQQVSTGQENAELGNETIYAFFEQTQGFLNAEMLTIEKLLEAELQKESRDPVAIEEFQKSLEELRGSALSIGALEKSMLAVERGGDEHGAAKNYIRIEGIKELRSLTHTVEKSKKRRQFAAETDQLPALKKLRRREEELERERLRYGSVCAGVFTIPLFLFMLPLGGAANASEPEQTPEAKFTEEKFSEAIDKAVENADLTQEEKEEIKEAVTRSDSPRRMVMAVRGLSIPPEKLTEIVTDMIGFLLEEIPESQRESLLPYLMPMQSLHQKLLRHESVTHEEAEKAVAYLGLGLVKMENIFEQQAKLLIVARSDIERALDGEPLRTEALAQIMNPQEVDAIRREIDKSLKSAVHAPLAKQISEMSGIIQQLNDSQAQEKDGMVLRVSKPA